MALPVTASAEKVSIAVPAAQRGILVANGAPGQLLVVVLGHAYASLCVSQDRSHSVCAVIVKAFSNHLCVEAGRVGKSGTRIHSQVFQNVSSLVISLGHSLATTWRLKTH